MEIEKILGFLAYPGKNAEEQPEISGAIQAGFEKVIDMNGRRGPLMTCISQVLYRSVTMILLRQHGLE